MKNQELFNKTVAILVKAYQNDTLRHSNCSACAVGNLIAHSNNFKFSKSGQLWINGNPEWQSIHVVCDGIQLFNSDCGNKIVGERQLLSTGYSIEQTAKIELAFENADFGMSDEDYMFNGLMSVVDCLMEIHEANNQEITAAKALFVRA